MQLFCVAHAGSTALNYYRWKNYLPDSAKVIPLELAGRGWKSDAKFYCDFEQAVEDLLFDLKGRRNEEEYALYGHSLGCWLIYELYYKIVEANLKPPKHLFFSGRYSPLTKQSNINCRTMDDTSFLEYIKSIGGMTEELLQNKALLDTYIKVLRADFEVIETYQYHPRNLIDCDITVLSGTEDSSISNQELMLWRHLTSQCCTICKIRGGHFFPFDNIVDTTAVIKDKLGIA